KAIKDGLIEINEKRVTPDTVICNSDLVTHKIHRHEPPVTTQELGIVRETEEGMLVVDKPGSIPVHPSGRYNYNSVIKILELKHGYSKLFPVNRLDRLTSGLMLIGLNADMARVVERQMVEHRIQKEYICKVKGEFPEGKIVCDQPIRVIAHKLSLNCVDKSEGKPSLTEFERLYTDGSHSIVYCKPKTGRTHQIRVHLQYLGYPIANDPLYCNTEVWGDHMGKQGELPADAQLGEQGVEQADEKAGEETDKQTVPSGLSVANGEAWIPLVRRMERWKDLQEEIERGEGDRVCDKCSIPAYPDPRPDQLCIWLHAWRYSGPGWEYETELPGWAKEAAKNVPRESK
ncbi:DRAP deaminase, partial [Linderina macrospora]